jgi:hypothetical protein
MELLHQLLHGVIEPLVTVQKKRQIIKRRAGYINSTKCTKCTGGTRRDSIVRQKLHLSDKNLAAYIFNHNWQLEFLQPNIDEIVTKCLMMHASAAPQEEPEEGNIIDTDEEEEAEEMQAGSGGGAGAGADVKVVVEEQEQEQMLK